MTTSPDDQQELEKEIERTREQLGETVEALAAKVDVKARAQEKLGQLTARLKGKAIEAKQQAGQTGQQIKKRPLPSALAGSAVGLLVLFVFMRRWMRRDQ